MCQLINQPDNHTEACATPFIKMMTVDLPFDVRPTSTVLDYDPQVQQHALSLSFNVRIPLQQMLEILLQYQRSVSSSPGGPRAGLHSPTPSGPGGGDAGASQGTAGAYRAHGWMGSNSSGGGAAPAALSGVASQYDYGYKMPAPDNNMGRGQDTSMEPMLRRVVQQKQDDPSGVTSRTTTANSSENEFTMCRTRGFGASQVEQHFMGDADYKNLMLHGRCPGGMVGNVRPDQGMLPVQMPPAFGGPAPFGNDNLSDWLLDAVKKGDAQQVARALRAGASPSSINNTPDRVPMLHHSVEQSRWDIVAQLLNAQCDANIPDAVGQTALHVAVSRCPQSDAVLCRLLLARQANPQAQNQDGTTPLSQMQSLVLGMRHDPGPAKMKIQQLAEEMQESPTASIYVHNDELISAYFADREGRSIILATATSISKYDVEKQAIATTKQLQKSGEFWIESIATNPYTGILAACVSYKTQQDQVPGQMVFIWLEGNFGLAQEKITKLNIRATVGEDRYSSSTIVMSRCKSDAEPSTIIVRRQDGQVFGWQFGTRNFQTHIPAPGNQGIDIKCEWKLSDEGAVCHQVCCSADGLWVAVAGQKNNQQPVTQVWNSGMRRGPGFNVVTRIKTEHGLLAISSSEDRRDAYLVASLRGRGTIEVLNLPGGQKLREFHSELPCCSLMICCGDSKKLFCAFEDGQVKKRDIKNGHEASIWDEKSMKNMDAMSDESILSVSSDFLRVYRWREVSVLI